MADNLVSNPGAEGPTFATDEIAGVHYPRTKLAIGPDGVAVDLDSGQEVMAGSLPVVLASDQSAIPVTDGGGSLTVDGSVTAIAQPGVDLGDVTVNNAAGAAAVNIQDGGNVITVDGTVAVSNSFALEATQLLQATAALQLPDGHNVTVDNGAGVAAVKIQDGGNSITVDGAVTTGGLTDVELRATPVPVSGTVSVVEPVTVDSVDLDIRDLTFAADKVDVSGSVVTAVVSATNLDIRDLVFASDKVDVSGSSGVGVTGPLTDTQLRATPVPVSGTVSVTEPVTVDAVDLDVRNLVFATDKIDASGSTGVGVTGPLTDTELRATPVPVSGTVSVTEPVTVDAVNLDIRDLAFASDKVDVSGSTGVGVTGPLTDTELRATPVPVSGTVSVTEPVTVDAVDLDIRNLVFATDKADVSGSTVAVTQVIPGTGATDLGKAEDAVHASGDVGVMALAVRSDAGGPFAADGEYVPLSTDATGAVRVMGGGGVEYTEDTPHVSGDTMKMAGVVQQAADAALSSDGDRSLIQVDGTGFVKVNVKTSALPTGAATAALQLPNSHDVTVDNAAGAAAVNIQDGGNSITVDGAVTVSGTATVSATDLDIRDLAFATDKVDVSGSSITVASHAVTNAGTFAVQESGAALTALQLIDDAVKTEDVAAAGGDKGFGILAIRRDADTSLVDADNDYAHLQVNANGALKVEIFDGGDSHTVDGTVSISGTVTVSATDLDIRNLVFATDKVDASGTTLGANSGVDVGDVTVNNAAGAGAVNIQDGGNAITVDGTIAFSNSTIAVTNAGTFAVQESGAALTALQLIDDAAVVLGTAVYTEATSVGLAAGAVRRDADTTLVNTTNEWGPLQMDVNGRLKVEAFSGETLPVSGTVTETNSGGIQTSVQLIDDAIFTLGTSTYTEATTKAMMAGALRRDADTTAVNTDNEISPLIVNATGFLKTVGMADQTDDGTGFTVATSKVSMVGFLADDTSTDSVDENDVGAARMTLDRKQIVVPQPHNLGGLSIHRSIDLDEGTLEVVKASPGAVYGMWVTNQATSTRWIKFYDATSGTLGTGTPVITIGIPGGTSDDVAGNFGPGGVGIQFATGISVGASTGVADADTGAPGVNDVIVNIFYK